MSAAKTRIIVIRSRYEFSGIKRYLELLCHSLAVRRGDTHEVVFAGHPDYLKYWPASLAKPRCAFPFKARMYHALQRALPRDRNLFGIPGMARMTRVLHGITARLFRLPDRNWAQEAEKALRRSASRVRLAFYCQPYPDDDPPAGVPAVCMWADFSEDRTPEYAEELRRSWSKWFERADRVVFLAETIRRRALELDPHLAPERTRVIDVPPWMLEATDEARARAKRLLPDSAGRRYALVPARAHPRKMQHRILEALSPAGAGGGSVIPVFCGPRTDQFSTGSIAGGHEVGEYCRTVWEQAARRGYVWGRDALALGLLDEPLLAALYECASLCIFPSRYEGLGLPLLEAMQAGIPVVCSDIPVFKEELEHRGLQAWFFKSEDVGSLTAALKGLLADWKGAQSCAEANRAVIRQYSPERFGREYGELFSEILERSSALAPKLR